MRQLLRVVHGCATTVGIVLAAAATAQVHESVFDEHILRGNLVGTMFLPAEQAEAHGIVRDPEHAVLNVVVLRRGPPQTSVRARVEARLIGATSTTHLTLREVAEHGGVSYLGSFRFAPGTVVDVVVTARPEGTQRELSMRFEDTLPAPTAR